MPHSPLTPCTEIAPTGSSMRNRRSMKKTAAHTSTPATPPISTAEGAVTKAHGAVMATRPASVPFANIEGSGLSYLIHMYSIAVMLPAAPASIVFVAMTPMRKSEPASVEPALKPNHPKARMNVPISAIGMLWPGIALTLPSALYFPRRGPSSAAATNAITPPVMCTTDDPAKSTCPCPSPRFLPSLATRLERETDRPVGEHRDAVDHEVHGDRVRGVLGTGEPGLDHCETGLHEHHEKPGDQRPHEVDRHRVRRGGRAREPGERVRRWH